MAMRKSWRLLMVLFVAASLLVAAGCSSGDGDGGAADEGAAADSGGGSDSAKGGEPEMTVTADELADAYKSDSAAADGKYKDKLLRVTGIVGTLPLADSGGDTFVQFGKKDEDGELLPIGSFYLMADEIPKADELWRGQEVTVVGKCLGAPIAGPALLECRIEKTGEPIPAVEIAAGDLIGEYQADAEAADGKYEDKLLIVTGVVATNDSDEQLVEIRGDEESGENPMRLQFGYGLIEKDLVDALKDMKPGDAIKIKGECGGKAAFKDDRIQINYVKILKQ